MAKTKTADKTKTKTKTASTRQRKAKRQHTLATHLERNGAHAYAERVPIMRDQLADDGPATVIELFKALKTSPTGLFATPRRVAATFRYDQRQDSPIFDRANGAITLRKRNRTAAGSKRNRASGDVSRKATRSPLGGRVNGKRNGTADARAFVASQNGAESRKRRKATRKAS